MKLSLPAPDELAAGALCTSRASVVTAAEAVPIAMPSCERESLARFKKKLPLDEHELWISLSILLFAFF